MNNHDRQDNIRPGLYERPINKNQKSPREVWDKEIFPDPSDIDDDQDDTRRAESLYNEQVQQPDLHGINSSADKDDSMYNGYNDDIKGQIRNHLKNHYNEEQENDNYDELHRIKTEPPSIDNY